MKKGAMLITGASGNVGRHLTEYYDKQGYCLCLLSNTRQLNTKHYSDTCDITDYAALEQALDKYYQATGHKISYLIHTATVRSEDHAELANSNHQIWQEVLTSNVLGAYNVLRLVIPQMRSIAFGRIVLFGSTITRDGLAGGSAYAAAKAAIANLTKSVCTEEADNGIIINTLSPGPIKIDSSGFSPEYQEFRQKYYNIQKAKIPLRRVAELSDLEGLCDLLISEKNTYLTGEEIFLSGGRL